MNNGGGGAGGSNVFYPPQQQQPIIIDIPGPGGPYGPFDSFDSYDYNDYGQPNGRFKGRSKGRFNGPRFRPGTTGSIGPDGSFVPDELSDSTDVAKNPAVLRLYGDVPAAFDPKLLDEILKKLIDAIKNGPEKFPKLEKDIGEIKTLLESFPKELGPLLQKLNDVADKYPKLSDDIELIKQKINDCCKKGEKDKTDGFVTPLRSREWPVDKFSLDDTYDPKHKPKPVPKFDESGLKPKKLDEKLLGSVVSPPTFDYDYSNLKKYDHLDGPSLDMMMSPIPFSSTPPTIPTVPIDSTDIFEYSALDYYRQFVVFIKNNIKQIINNEDKLKNLMKPTKIPLLLSTSGISIDQKILDNLKKNGIDETDLYEYIEKKPSIIQLRIPRKLLMNNFFSSKENSELAVNKLLELNKLLTTRTIDIHTSPNDIENMFIPFLDTLQNIHKVDMPTLRTAIKGIINRDRDAINERIERDASAPPSGTNTPDEQDSQKSFDMDEFKRRLSRDKQIALGKASSLISSQEEEKSQEPREALFGKRKKKSKMSRKKSKKSKKRSNKKKKSPKRSRKAKKRAHKLSRKARKARK